MEVHCQHRDIIVDKSQSGKGGRSRMRGLLGVKAWKEERGSMAES